MNDTQIRLGRVRAAMAEQDLDGLVVSEAGNRRWLTGFTGSTGWPVVTARDAFLLTDSRYYEQVERQAPDFRLERAPARPMERLAELLAEAGLSRVGVEAETVTLGQLERLRAAGATLEWVPTTGLVEVYRAVKSDQEVVRIAAAARLGDLAVEHAKSLALPGMSEKDLAWQLERFMRENGADGLAFEIIVAAGENGSLPHHTPTDRPIGVGEPIVIDLGARIDGYNGDLTRTFSVGKARDAEYEQVYETVLAANRAAIAAMRPGMTGPEADGLARQVIEDAGYGEWFGHGLGHGVGLNVHEAPRLGPAADDSPLRSGMVVTIEPGIYLPGRFGVRIEDLAVLRDDGVELLSRASLEPVIPVP